MLVSLLLILLLTFRQLEQAWRRSCPKSIYTPAQPHFAGHPSFFLYFPTTAPAWRNAVSAGIFPPQEGEQVIWGDHQPIGQASSDPRGLGFCQLLALHMMHLPIVLYSPKVFLHTAAQGPALLLSSNLSLLAPQSGALIISAYRNFQSHPYHL